MNYFNFSKALRATFAPFATTKHGPVTFGHGMSARNFRRLQAKQTPRSRTHRIQRTQHR